MIVKTEAFVLHSLKYGEQKLIVDVFTRQQGRLSFVVPLPRSAKGRLKKQYFQPLTLLTITFNYLPQQQLQRLSDATIATPLPSLQTDAAKLAIGLFVAEFLYHALKGEQRNEPLFQYVWSALQWLDGCSSPFANFHLVFLLHLSSFLGFHPNLEHYSPQSFFDLRAGTFCPTAPLHRDYLLPQEAAMMRLMMRMDLPTMHLFRMNRHERARCLDVALTYYRLHLPDFPPLRSVGVLQELFQ